MEVLNMIDTRRVSVKMVSRRPADNLEVNINKALSDIYENANNPKIIDIKLDNMVAMIIYEWSEDPTSEAKRLPEQIE